MYDQGLVLCSNHILYVFLGDDLRLAGTVFIPNSFKVILGEILLHLHNFQFIWCLSRIQPAALRSACSTLWWHHGIIDVISSFAKSSIIHIYCWHIFHASRHFVVVLFLVLGFESAVSRPTCILTSVEETFRHFDVLFNKFVNWFLRCAFRLWRLRCENALAVSSGWSGAVWSGEACLVSVVVDDISWCWSVIWVIQVSFIFVVLTVIGQFTLWSCQTSRCGMFGSHISKSFQLLVSWQRIFTISAILNPLLFAFLVDSQQIRITMIIVAIKKKFD